MSETVKELLVVRNGSHGPYKVQGVVAQDLKLVVQKTEGYQKMPGTHRESVDMILHKISRIVVGDPNFKDHWDDISGYAQLISRML